MCACLCPIGDWYFDYFGLYTVMSCGGDPHGGAHV